MGDDVKRIYVIDAFPTYLIMTPGKHDVIQATTRLIDAVLGRIQVIFRVRVRRKGIWIYNLIQELAANDWRVCQLRFQRNMVQFTECIL